MTGNEIRKTFLDFFKGNAHAILPSSSLVPVGDPSVLFTTAGMQQFKPYYSGEKRAPHPRVATAQKVLRTSDIESVGDAFHLTFFEMLGNFAFDDYFKRESIEFAWELLVGKLGVDPEKTWATCFGGEGGVPRDEESPKFWQRMGVPAERIRFFGRKDNFWGPTGDSGPCGPCTEVHYELRPAEPGHDCSGPNCECERFVELWNLVFNEYLQDASGNLVRLKSVGVDTGAGLERWAVILQGKSNVYETDLFEELVSVAREALGTPRIDGLERALRIIAEHTRASVFLLADGVMPGNVGRGYVLRRLLRRTVGQARLAGQDGPFAVRVAEAAIATMGNSYPEVLDRRGHIVAVIEDEEERFGRTLSRGLSQLEDAIDGLGDRGRLAGDRAFVFHDTYGVPIDLIRDLAGSRSVTVDEEGFALAMERQRTQSRAALASAACALPTGLPASKFTGYEGVTAGEGRVTAILASGESSSLAQEGEEAMLVLDQTPFYAEAGGQVGDAGTIQSGEFWFLVSDTQSNGEGAIFHIGVVERGRVEVGAGVRCEADAERRADTARNHTATHLLHAALRKTLGEHALQSGSLVGPDRLRFDFKHSAALAREEIEAIENEVNRNILHSLDVATVNQEVGEAVGRGALALFGEAYGDVVRAVSIGDVSNELCGGTHLSNTAHIGSLSILRDENIGSGLRRIEAVTGRGATAASRLRLAHLQELAGLLNVSVDEVPARVEALVETGASQRREIAQLRRRLAALMVNGLVGQARELDGFKIVAAKTGAGDAESFKEISDSLRSKLGGDWAFLLGAEIEGRPLFFAAASDSAVGKGADAGKVIRAAAGATGGGGGGGPSMANGGGRDPSKLQEGIDAGLAVLRAGLAG